MMFTNAEFMTIREKAIVLKNWERFLQHGMRMEHFTKRLYDYLHQQCGFIAHYNIHGFYGEYFTSGMDVERFFEQFLTNTTQYCGADPDCNDLNVAMRDVYKRHRRAIAQQVDEDVEDKIATLETYVRKAKEDKDCAKQVLRNLRM